MLFLIGKFIAYYDYEEIPSAHFFINTALWPTKCIF